MRAENEKSAKIATASGTDMVIANGSNIFTINEVMEGKEIGTLFLSSAGGAGRIQGSY